MVMHDVFGAMMLGLFAAAPILTFRARYGFWRATRIADFVDGERVKVDGVVEPIGKPLRAPYIDMECVAFSLAREDLPPPGQRGDEFEAQDFMLRDGAGDTVLVRAGARCYLDAGRRVRDLRHGVDAQLIQAGDAVSVIGYAAEVPALDGMGATYREPPRRWILSGSDRHELVIIGRTSKRRR